MTHGASPTPDTVLSFTNTPPSPGSILFTTLFILFFGVAAGWYGVTDGDFRGVVVGVLLALVAVVYGIAAAVVHLA